MYGALRDLIMVNTPGSIFLGAIWNYLGSVATLCVEIAIIFKYVNYIIILHTVSITTSEILIFMFLVFIHISLVLALVPKVLVV